MGQRLHAPDWLQGVTLAQLLAVGMTVGEATTVVHVWTHGTARERTELDLWLQDRMLTPHATDAPDAARGERAIVAPRREGSAAGVLYTGSGRRSYRGVRRAEDGVGPGREHYAPGDGYAALRARLQALRDAAQERGAARRDMVAAKQARRAAHTARQGTATPLGTYCAGYRPRKRKQK